MSKDSRTIVITIPVADYVTDERFADLLAEVTAAIEDLQLHSHEVAVTDSRID